MFAPSADSLAADQRLTCEESDFLRLLVLRSLSRIECWYDQTFGDPTPELRRHPDRVGYADAASPFLQHHRHKESTCTASDYDEQTAAHALTLRAIPDKSNYSLLKEQPRFPTPHLRQLATTTSSIHLAGSHLNHAHASLALITSNVANNTILLEDC